MKVNRRGFFGVLCVLPLVGAWRRPKPPQVLGLISLEDAVRKAYLRQLGRAATDEEVASWMRNPTWERD